MSHGDPLADLERRCVRVRVQEWGDDVQRVLRAVVDDLSKGEHDEARVRLNDLAKDLVDLQVAVLVQARVRRLM